MEKLFSYGTLQSEKVQLKHFNRKLSGQYDRLPQYELRNCAISDPDVLKTSGEANHPIACFTGNLNDKVEGMVFDLSKEELAQADAYEVDDYKRITCTLESGISAWVYVQR